jgi:hypothetical protein
MRVAWQSSGARVMSRVATLGLGGLFIDAKNPPSVCDVIQLIFEVPGGEVRARAIVRVSHPGKGMGVEFTAMSPEARARLQHLLQRLVSPNPSAKRRSTRVAESVSVMVSGVDAGGQPFKEETVTVQLSCHGCSYISRSAGAQNSCLSVEVPNQQAGAPPHRLRARMVWNGTSENQPGLFHVGVEFDEPGNVWSLANPPEDWRQGEIPGKSDPTAFEREMKKLIATADTCSYYQLLGVTPDSPLSQVKRNYYELARKFHPDRHMDHPERMQPLQKLMHTVTFAYKTLSDADACVEYDRRLVASGTFDLGRTKSELQQTTEECLEEAQKCIRAKNYRGSILWLRKAVEIEPASSRYHTLLARSLSAVPIYRRDAMEHAQRAIVLDSTNVTAHLQLAELYEEMKLPWRARPHYAKVLEIDAENSEARERLLLLDAEENKSGSHKRVFIDKMFGRSSK